MTTSHTCHTFSTDLNHVLNTECFSTSYEAQILDLSYLSWTLQENIMYRFYHELTDPFVADT
jgi:hypothetical protein